jgi:hypothetical protein
MISLMFKEITREEALALFQRWKDSLARVSVGFNSPSALQGQFDGYVAVVSEPLIVIGSHERTNTNLQFSMDECRFVFPDVKNEKESDAFADAEPLLHLLFPGGARCSVIAYVVPN